MTEWRLQIAFWITLMLVALVIFSQYRWSLVEACHRRGGVWDGVESKCRLVPARLFIDQAPQRT